MPLAVGSHVREISDAISRLAPANIRLSLARLQVEGIREDLQELAVKQVACPTCIPGRAHNGDILLLEIGPRSNFPARQGDRMVTELLTSWLRRSFDSIKTQVDRGQVRMAIAHFRSAEVDDPEAAVSNLAEANFIEVWRIEKERRRLIRARRKIRRHRVLEPGLVRRSPLRPRLTH